MLSSRPVVARHSSNIVVNDENAAATAHSMKKKNTRTSEANVTVQKTPAATSKSSRRVFGDISNKRHEGIAERKAVSQTPHHHFETSTHKSTKKPVRLLFQDNNNTKRSVNFADEISQTVPVRALLPANSVVTKGASFDVDEDLYDEIERPLGRTYQQQMDHGDHDDDDTVLSLQEDLDTMIQNRKAFDDAETQSKLSYQNEFQQRIAEFDQEIDDFGKRDAAAFVDCLYAPNDYDSALNMYLDEFERDTMLHNSISGDGESYWTTNNLDISFG